jgi:hypothetical protein
MVNDLLDDNVCLVFLQSFDDASAMELFSFARSSKVFILAKKYTCINNIPMHTKSRKVIYQDFHQINFNFFNHMDVFIGISNWIDVVFFWQTLFLHANVLTKPKGSFKFQFGCLVDPLSDPIELNTIYNHIPNDVLPMKTPQRAWRGAHFHNHAFMQMLLKTCSPLGFWILDLTIRTIFFESSLNYCFTMRKSCPLQLGYLVVTWIYWTFFSYNKHNLLIVFLVLEYIHNFFL